MYHWTTLVVNEEENKEKSVNNKRDCRRIIDTIRYYNLRRSFYAKFEVQLWKQTGEFVQKRQILRV